MHTPAKALVLEGKTTLAYKVKSLLESLGYTVAAITASGTDAIARCRQELPDILIIGADLHGLIGPEVTLRMIHEFARVPVVYLGHSAAPDGAAVASEDDLTTQRLTACIAHAYGVVAWEASAGPPQDFILDDRILLRHEERMVRILIDDILYVTDQRNYSSIELADGSYLVAIPIQLVEHRLSPYGFLRIHHSYLVNQRFITEARAKELVLDQVTLPIGRPYRRSVGRRVREFG